MSDSLKAQSTTSANSPIKCGSGSGSGGGGSCASVATCISTDPGVQTALENFIENTSFTFTQPQVFNDDVDFNDPVDFTDSVTFTNGPLTYNNLTETKNNVTQNRTGTNQINYNDTTTIDFDNTEMTGDLHMQNLTIDADNVDITLDAASTIINNGTTTLNGTTTAGTINATTINATTSSITNLTVTGTLTAPGASSGDVIYSTGIAGENLTAGDYVTKRTQNYMELVASATSNDNINTGLFAGQSIGFTEDVKLESFIFYKNSTNPINSGDAVSFEFRVYAATGALGSETRTGSTLYTKTISNVVAGAGAQPIAFDNLDYVFLSGQRYVVGVVKTAGFALDMQAQYNNTNPYSGGNYVYDTSAVSGSDLYFELGGFSLVSKIIKLDSTQFDTAVPYGVVTGTVTSGNPATIQRSGTYTTSGLTTGAIYYATTTPGTIGVTPNSYKVGYAISTTQLILNYRPKVPIAAGTYKIPHYGDIYITVNLNGGTGNVVYYSDCRNSPSNVLAAADGGTDTTNHAIGIGGLRARLLETTSSGSPIYGPHYFISLE